jgi:heterodisulfide reductase subunit A-like polyferredoxin
VNIHCDAVGISTYGTGSAVDPVLIEATGMDTDPFGLLQENNIHLFPGETNRRGVYVAGAARGTFYIPDIIQEAKAVAESVHLLLSQGSITVEMSNATVDTDKCVLCLTCIRSCPYKAMYIDHEKGAAQSVAEACMRCGICAGECPAKAIELPVYSDSLLFSYIE